MRGKNTDNEFVMNFINECAKANKTTPEEICQQALSKIEEINKQLKLRVKLTDVLSFFNYRAPKVKKEKEKIFSGETVDEKTAAHIQDLILKGANSTKELLNEFVKFDSEYKKKLVFTMKQLFEREVIQRDPDNSIYYKK